MIDYRGVELYYAMQPNNDPLPTVAPIEHKADYASKIEVVHQPIEDRYDLIPSNALQRIASYIGKEVLKNEEYSLPDKSYSEYINTALKHLNLHGMGYEEEDHLAIACYNLMKIMDEQCKEADLRFDCHMKDEPVQLSMDFH